MLLSSSGLIISSSNCMLFRIIIKCPTLEWSFKMSVLFVFWSKNVPSRILSNGLYRTSSCFCRIDVWNSRWLILIGKSKFLKRTKLIGILTSTSSRTSILKWLSSMFLVLFVEIKCRIRKEWGKRINGHWRFLRMSLIRWFR